MVSDAGGAQVCAFAFQKLANKIIKVAILKKCKEPNEAGWGWILVVFILIYLSLKIKELVHPGFYSDWYNKVTNKIC